MKLPQRLLSVRNKTYILSPLPGKKQPLSTQLSRVTMGLIGLGSFAVLGYSGILAASLFKTQSNRELSAKNTPAADTVVRLPPIADSNTGNQSSNPGTSDNGILRPSTDASQRSDQVAKGRENPFTFVRELSVLLPGKVKWNQPTSIPSRGNLSQNSSSENPSENLSENSSQNSNQNSGQNPSTVDSRQNSRQNSIATGLKVSSQGVKPNHRSVSSSSSGGARTKTSGIALNPKEIPAVPSLPVPNLNPPIPNSTDTTIQTPVVNPPGANPVAVNPNCDVQVNGVIQAPSETMIVLKVKSDENSYNRAVRIGDRLCNGAVAVSQVIGLGGPQPTVVLEQYGQSIYRPVETNLVPRT